MRALNKESEYDESGNNLLYPAIFIGLTTDRDNLYKRIDDRVDVMLHDGLLEEVKTLYDKGIRSKAIMTGIGYKELYKYFDKEIDKIEKINKGDLIDLRAAETVEMKKGDFKLIKLGVGMKLPDGYKANMYPRSSTYKNFGIILANSVGQIDNSYSGDNDEWKFPAIALRDTVIHKNDRICQFEIQRIQPEIEFEEVEHLDEESRGGIGSTGTK